MIVRDRNFRAVAPAFIRRESGLVVPDRRFDVHAARRIGFKSPAPVIPALSFENSWSWTNSNEGAPANQSITFSTSGSGRTLVWCWVSKRASSTPGVASVSGGGLTWTRRGSNIPWVGAGTERGAVEIWTAYAATQLTGQTVSWASVGGVSLASGIRMLSFVGVHSTAPLDTHVNSTKDGNNATASNVTPNTTNYSTNAADTISLVMWGSTENSSITAGSGWTGSVQVNVNTPAEATGMALYRINSTTFSAATLSWASGARPYWGYQLITLKRQT